MKNKKLPLIAGIVIILLLSLGGMFFFFSKSGSDKGEIDTNASDVIGSLSAEEIGLKLIVSNDNKKVKVVVEKVADIFSLEYDISYDADIPASEVAPGESGGKVERGFSDEAKISSQSKYESKDFDLGSCSRNVCRYDTGVEEVRIVMKVVKKDNKVYEVKDSIKL